MTHNRKCGPNWLTRDGREERDNWIRVCRVLIECVPGEGGVYADVEVEGWLGAVEEGSGMEEVWGAYGGPP